MKGLFLTLFLATAAFAQPVVGPEVSTPALDGAGDVALAPLRDGFVVTWEQNGRIYAGHLDATLQLTGAVFELPLLDRAAIALSPAIASNGTSVLVAWHEQHLGLADTNVVATLTAGVETLLHGPRLMNLTGVRPVAGSAHGSYVVYTGDLEYRLNERLETESLEGLPGGLSAAVSTNGQVATATYKNTGAISCGGIFGGGPCNFSYTFSFSLPSRLNFVTYQAQLPSATFYPIRNPIIAADGDSFVALTQMTTKTEVIRFSGADVRQTALPTILTNAALAGNGTDVVIIWTGPPLRGIVLHADGTLSDPFLISGSSIDEPHIVVTGSNQLVAFYRIDLGSHHKAFAARTIHLRPLRQRSIR